MSWPRDAWAEAVWASDLKPLARFVALCFADHARDKDTAWVSYPRLRERTGLSRDAINRNLSAVVDKGWLVVHTPARQHRATVYRLVIPHAQQYVSRTAEESVSRTADPLSSTSPDTSSTSPDTSSTGDGTHHTTDHKTTPPPPSPSDAGALVVVVSQNIPRDLALGLNRNPLTTQCRRLALEGATPEALAAAVKAHSWTSAGPGALIAWLKSLDGSTLTTTSQASGIWKSAGCDTCQSSGFTGEDHDGRPIPCATCRPHLIKETHGWWSNSA